MREEIAIGGKQFKIFIPAREIDAAISTMAGQINADYRNRKPIFIALLNGAFIFAADLLRKVNIECEISFVKVASYVGRQSTGDVKSLIGLNTDIKGKPVIVLDDIVDTGQTLEHILPELEMLEPAEVKLAALLLKPEAVKTNIKPDYVGLEIPNEFIVGYGLDYNGYGRNLKDIYQIVD